MESLYDDEAFFSSYSKMDRSIGGLPSSGEWYLLKKHIPKLEGKKVLDLGCGFGWHSMYAVENGAEYVLGLDISHRMLEEARRRNSSYKIEYRECSIEEYEYPEGKFDFVISNLALHYVRNLSDVFKNVYKTLVSGGCFLFNIEHPVFTSGINQEWIYNSDHKPLYWPVDNYFYPGERRVDFLSHSVLKEHHTLTDIVMGLLDAGFRLDVFEEVYPSPDMLSIEGMSDEMRRPMMLIIRGTKLL